MCYNEAMETYNVVMDRPKREPGRPPGGRFVRMMSIRLTERQSRWLEVLADRYQCDQVDVLRRALAELARREGVSNGDTLPSGEE